MAGAARCIKLAAVSARTAPSTPSVLPPAAHAAAHARTDLSCRNCGAHAPQAYCGQCGQETTLHPPTLGEFVHEFVGHYVALEGALWRSLALLVARPGRLTREYLDGRRRRYVLPLRLYLSASFLFFLVLKLVPAPVGAPVLTVRPSAAHGAASAAVSSRAPASLPLAAAAPASAPVRWETMRPVDCGRAGEPPCGVVAGFANHVGERFSADPRGFVEHLRAQAFGLAPYVAFLLLPAFAGLVGLAYRNRGMTYGEHVVFSLHLHAFWYLVLAAATLLPAGLGDLLLWALPVYGVMALREVYRGGWAATLARAAALSLAYGALLLAATFAMAVALLSH